jgi:hypothetical protein
MYSEMLIDSNIPVDNIYFKCLGKNENGTSWLQIALYYKARTHKTR